MRNYVVQRYRHADQEDCVHRNSPPTLVLDNLNIKEHCHQYQVDQDCNRGMLFLFILDKYQDGRKRYSRYQRDNPQRYL
ncbi:MAG: hypothetical protein FWC54_04620 [Actinomycetia bacterium]|nr:hypothetical protein [Actinomycetes bacterium]